MEVTIPYKPIEVSNKFKSDLKDVYDYTFDTFGSFQAQSYL